MQKTFIALVGSQNNVGDHLIGQMGKEIIQENLDAKVILINRFNEKNDEFYFEVNKSDGLILLGGPALRKNFLKTIYGINLDKVTVKIIALGIGWKSLSGSFYDTFSYEKIGNVDELKKISFSVRDYYSKYALYNQGVENVSLTGCPALFSSYVGVAPVFPKIIKNIVFSVGVEFSKSKSLRKQTYKLIKALASEYNITVAFHHGIGFNYRSAKNFNSNLYNSNLKLIKYLKENNIEFTDVSGTIENFQNLYKKTDLHIGYRVHAHIYSMSINKPSILICEDGRGKALKETVSGLYFDAFSRFEGTLFSKILNRLFNYDQYNTNELLSKLIINELKEEIKNNYPRISQYRKDIDGYKKNMVEFLVRELN
jgi:hypothetical protein